MALRVKFLDPTFRVTFGTLPLNLKDLLIGILRHRILANCIVIRSSKGWCQIPKWQTKVPERNQKTSFSEGQNFGNFRIFDEFQESQGIISEHFGAQLRKASLLLGVCEPPRNFALLAALETDFHYE